MLHRRLFFAFVLLFCCIFSGHPEQTLCSALFAPFAMNVVYFCLICCCRGCNVVLGQDCDLNCERERGLKASTLSLFEILAQ